MERSGNLLEKLYTREINGRFPQSQQIPRSLFRQFPGRLAVCLKDIVPSPSVFANHVFLGFSKCGQFLISYTQSTEFDDTSRVYMKIEYRLHWWLFVPHQPLRKVSEVTLFGDMTIEYRLLVAVCYWPADESRVLIYGRPDLEVMDPSHGSRCYLTITAVPSLDRCRDCFRVAESYCEDDLAQSWDSCVRLSCQRHGLTVHTCFDLVQPYPPFQPVVSLARRGSVIVNTGNFLHVITARLEPGRSVDCGSSVASGCPERLGSSLVSLQVDVGDETACVRPPLPSGAPWRFDVRVLRDASPAGAAAVQSGAPTPVAIASPRRCRARTPLRYRPRGLPAARQPDIAADEYEFFEDGLDPRRENFSMFRKKRLADKKYEFSDENSENVPRFFVARGLSVCGGAGPTVDVSSSPRTLVPVSDALLSPVGGIHSKRRVGPPPPPPAAASPTVSVWDEEDQQQYVLRTIDRNTEPDVFLGSPRPASSAGSDADSVELFVAGRTPFARPQHQPQCRTQPPPLHAPGACCVRLCRSYVEVDDELVSVITDIEEDDLCRSTGYHYALPLEVHGSAYSQMQMVSNSKAQILALSRVVVQQTSLDVEQFCHEVAQKLCTQAGKKYWFCNDYDVEIVNVCADSGEVTAVAVVLIQAAGSLRPSNNTPRRCPSGGATGSCGVVTRHQYRGQFLFRWSLDTGQYALLASSPLCELAEQVEDRTADGWWNPARQLAEQLRPSSRLVPPAQHHHSVAVMTNQPELIGASLRSIVDWNHMTALLLENPPRSADEY